MKRLCESIDKLTAEGGIQESRIDCKVIVVVFAPFPQATIIGAAIREREVPRIDILRLNNISQNFLYKFYYIFKMLKKIKI
jgi:hypothetical protein